MKFTFPLSILFLLSLCGLNSPLAAQSPFDSEREPQGLESDFLRRVWETADGLLPTNVRSIAQTHDGYVWMATIDGFVRFDGARATLISGKNTPGLPSLPKVARVHTDGTGRLWGATTEGRLFSFDQQMWREYGAADGWPGLLVESMTESADGKLIFSGAKSVLRFEGGHFSPMAIPDLPVDFQPPLKAIYDRENKLWLTSLRHVWQLDGETWKVIVAAKNRDALIEGAAPARDGGLWLATPQQVRKFVGEKVVATHERPEDFRNDAVELLEDFHGNLWAGGANSGLRIWLKDGRFQTASRSAESLQTQIACLFEDRERNVLVGTSGAGLARFKPRPFSVWLGRLGGLAGTIVNAVCEEAPGSILVGTEGSGLRRIRGNQLPTILVSKDGTLGPKHRITSIVRCRDGTVLAAVSGRGLYRVEEDAAVFVPVESLKAAHARAMFEDSRGRLWIGHANGLTLRENGQFHLWSPAGSAPLTNVRAIAEDQEGAIWFIAKEGLARLVGDKLEMVSLPELRAKANLLSLFVESDGDLWIGVESTGLLRLSRGQRFLFTAKHGLPVNSPGALVEENGYLWYSGEKGIVRVSCASFDAVAEGRTNRLELQLFNRADGLPSDACRRGYQPAACRASDGALWFATHKGVVTVHPSEIFTATYEPPAIIEEIRAEMQLIPVTAANRNRIDIPAGTRHMSIRCSVPSLGKPEYARFQYQLEGFDDQWRDAGEERVIRFYDLRPGNYRFRVRATGTDGRLVETPAFVGIRMHPFYWQMLWFRALCLALLVGIVAFAVWRIQKMLFHQREERLRAQEARLQLEAQLQQAQKMEAIGQLAGGIAHDFNNLLTTVVGGADLLLMDLDAKSDAHQLVSEIATAGTRARDLVSQILTFSRQRPLERHHLDLAPVLREVLPLIRAGIPAMIEVKTKIPETLPAILADASEVQRIVMNLCTNAAHAVGSAKGHIAITVDTAEVSATHPPSAVPPGRYVRLVVDDDGRGMDDETLRRIFDPFFTTKEVGEGTGLGLSVVHGIVQAHDAFITVDSEPGEGTEFRVFFPIIVDVATANPAPAPPAASGEGERILLVDDEESVLKVTRAMLIKLGYQVDAFGSPTEILQAFAENPRRYRLLITDFAMPQLDGVALAQRIWETHPGFPIILYSGYGAHLTPEEAVELGFARMLGKPFKLDMLSDAVRQALDRKPLTGASGPQG